jgi:hypothetical protein
MLKLSVHLEQRFLLNQEVDVLLVVLLHRRRWPLLRPRRAFSRQSLILIVLELLGHVAKPRSFLLATTGSDQVCSLCPQASSTSLRHHSFWIAPCQVFRVVIGSVLPLVGCGSRRMRKRKLSALRSQVVAHRFGGLLHVHPSVHVLLFCNATFVVLRSERLIGGSLYLHNLRRPLSSFLRWKQSIVLAVVSQK